MKLFVSAILMAVDAQQGGLDGRRFGGLEEIGITDLGFGEYDDYALDGASYEADYSAGFTGPNADDDERRRPNKEQLEDIAAGGAGDSFGDGFGDYGVSDVAFGDYGGFEDYGGFNTVDAPAAPSSGFVDTASSVAAGPGGREFEADTLGGQNIADDGTSATRSCLTCQIQSLADFASCTPKSCGGVDADAIEDTRDYCLIEVRSTDGAFDQLEMRCAEPKDCQASFFDNVRGVDPTRHDTCRPLKDDNGVNTGHYTGRWANIQSVCRNCVVMANGANGSGNYNVEVTGSTVKIHNKAGAALTDVSGNANVLTWSREMWHGGESNIAYEKQNA